MFHQQQADFLNLESPLTSVVTLALGKGRAGQRRAAEVPRCLRLRAQPSSGAHAGRLFPWGWCGEPRGQVSLPQPQSAPR